MKNIPLNCIFIITMLTCTGCVSSSINDSIALIEQEESVKESRVVNKKVLQVIQSLRSSQMKVSQNYSFAYDWKNKELNYEDKIKIQDLIKDENQLVIISVAPAKGLNKLDQLSLSMSRAEVLRLYISGFNNRITIQYDPKLSNNTINIEVGA